MQPTMMPGDVVTVICDQRRVKAGEIAVYANGQRLLAHRVVAAGRFGILTKPDSVPMSLNTWNSCEIPKMVETQPSWDGLNPAAELRRMFT